MKATTDMQSRVALHERFSARSTARGAKFMLVSAVSIAAVCVSSGIAAAEPSARGETIAAQGRDGSIIEWTVPDTGAAARGVTRSTFETMRSDDGAATIITIPNSSAPSTYEFPLTLPDGFTTQPQPNGSITINNADGLPIGAFAAPWAKDAAGGEIATQLTVERGVLVQTVQFDDSTAFPVTADPNFSYGIYSGNIYFNRAETATIASGGWGAAAITGVCLTAGGPAVAAACGLAAGAIVYQAGVANNSYGCLQIDFNQQGWVSPHPYNDYGRYCR